MLLQPVMFSLHYIIRLSHLHFWASFLGTWMTPKRGGNELQNSVFSNVVFYEMRLNQSIIIYVLSTHYQDLILYVSQLSSTSVYQDTPKSKKSSTIMQYFNMKRMKASKSLFQFPASSHKPEPLELTTSWTSSPINCPLRQDQKETWHGSQVVCADARTWLMVWCHTVTAAGTL